MNREFELPQDIIDLLPEQAYWEGNRTILSHVERVSEDLGLEVPQQLYDYIEQNNLGFLGNYKIYSYVNNRLAYDTAEPPYDIVIPQQLIKNLFKQDFLYDGERRATTWYAQYNEDTMEFIEPVVKFEYQFNRNAEGFAVSRQMIASWALDSGEWSPITKTSLKYYYSKQVQITELETRRINIVNQLKGQALDLGIASAMTELFNKYEKEIILYTEAGTPDLREAVNNDTAVWLDAMVPGRTQTIKEYMYEIFSIGIINDLQQ